MAVVQSKTRFTDRDRSGAVIFAIRMSRMDQEIYVVFYDYAADVWCAEKYTEFHKTVLVCYEDLRYVLPQGEVTKLS